MKTLIALSCAALLGATLNLKAADTAELKAHEATYHAAGKALVDMALAKKVNATDAAKHADVLVKDAVWLCGVYAKAFPQGEKLLKTITDHLEDMKKLSFKDLEHQWHDLHFFDGKKDAIALDMTDEANEHFTDPIHSLVHPLMVLSAANSFAKDGNAEALTQMKEEMEEGLEQYEKAVQTLSKK